MVRKTLQYCIAIISVVGCSLGISLPFSIVPNGSLPTTVVQNSTVLAQYIVINKTNRILNNNFVKYLPPNVAQTTSSGFCGSTFTLMPNGVTGDRCTLELIVSGPVSASDSNPHHHLFVCASDKVTCAGTSSPLNVAVVSGILYAGAANGNVYFSENGGASWQTTTVPSAGNAVNSVFATSTSLYIGSADHFVYYSTDNGTNWTQTSASPDASAVNSVFVLSANTLYIGTEGGHLYISTNNGTSWTPAPTQPSGSAVNSIFIVSSTVWYAGSADGNVYYTANGGTSWTPINGLPDGSAIHNIFATQNMLYVDTANEYVYTSTSLTGGGSWTTYAQTVFSLFVNATGAVIDAGTQGGYIYSLTTGDEVGFVAYSPINSVFFLGA
jgi:photosystem II stability/assembly factor-like uncharacterized protein